MNISALSGNKPFLPILALSAYLFHIYFISYFIQIIKHALPRAAQERNALQPPYTVSSFTRLSRHLSKGYSRERACSSTLAAGLYDTL